VRAAATGAVVPAVRAAADRGEKRAEGARRRYDRPAVKILVLFDLYRRPGPDERFSPSKLDREEDKPTEADVLRALKRLGHETDTLPVFDNVPDILEKLSSFRPDVVFNLSESFLANRGQEPNIPALLELMKVRYTGSGPGALMLCKDKSLAKKILHYHRVRVARGVVSTRRRPLQRLRRLMFPAFVKPVGEEGSDGIAQASFVRDEEEALERARFVHERIKTDALIEEYIEGRELYVGVLRSRQIDVFPPREIFFTKVPEDAPKFATFSAKWDEAYRKKWGIKNGDAGELPDGVADRLQELARTVGRVLKIRGPGRVDVRLTPDNELVVIEANPNPSLAHDEDFAQAALKAGIEYDALVQRILDDALRRPAGPQGH
jgi:D-alanine-D-alanine ligase